MIDNLILSAILKPLGRYPKKKGKMEKAEYTITINFQTDRALTPYELNALESHLMLQIDEPVNENQEDETYETKDATYKTERIK